MSKLLKHYSVLIHRVDVKAFSRVLPNDRQIRNESGGSSVCAKIANALIEVGWMSAFF